ncbi:subtilisin-like protein [Hypoxylon fragiforme]|uniref:subtilisin-like protein n=1 Tax=Hypoxylon fragiforme TaxID=63214 RepID=UPI0020C6CF23|nr:subtilisin-like protein [Hypoxylon fragiforme]KAI2606174.1 subtilisin-like protein [Hypoxylon fragiforme]
MRVNASLLALLLGASDNVWGAQVPSRRDLNETAKLVDNPTPRRFIVELKSRAQRAHISSKVAGLSGLRVVKEFDSDLFPGMSIQCDSHCDEESITSALDADEDGPVVASVYKSSIMRLLPHAIEGESYSDDAAAKNYSVHGSTGVEKLHLAGIIGEGATVAIVDSGIQYTHPALGGGIGPNYTVIGGYDLVGKDWPDVPAEPDNDPMDEYGHGTHVAGIIAGKSDQFVGVAPGAKLLSFKVFGDTGYSNEEIVIEAFLKAFDSGADIISASLGETSGFTSNAWAVLASRMVEQGVVISIAAGNDGASGPFDASNGASGKNVITVGAAEPGEFPAQAFSADFNLDGQSNKTQLAYLPTSTAFPSTVLGWPIRPVTLNASVENDACQPLPADTASFNGSIALVRIGGCTATVKHTNIAAFGAQYILFYNDDGFYSTLSSGNTTGLIASVEERAAAAIIETIVAGGNVTASFDITTGNYVGLYNSGGGRPTRFTSWGGTYDLALKPDVVAPGDKILSTYPTNQYRVLSGSSMATPYIAGVAALWVGKNGGRAAHASDPAWAKRLTARIMGTARAVAWADWATSSADYGFWAPAGQVGAGFVDAERVLGYTTELGFEGRKFELNDTTHFAGTHSVDIINLGTEPVTYNFSLQDAGGYDAWLPVVPGKPQSFVPEIKLYPDVFPVKMTPGITFPEGVFTVGPGESKTAEFTFTAPTGLNESSLPVYSGKVLISGSNGEELGVPYFGIACDLNQTISNIWDYGSSFPFLNSGLSDTRIAQKSNFTFNFSSDSQDFPKFYSQFAWGTEELRWDIMEPGYTEAEWSYPPVVGANKFLGAATSWNGTGESAYFIEGRDNEDDIFPFPVFDQARDKRGIYFWLGRFANGTNIVPGVYQFRIAALRAFGDPKSSYDWDIWATPLVTILPKNGSNSTVASR